MKWTVTVTPAMGRRAHPDFDEAVIKDNVTTILHEAAQEIERRFYEGMYWKLSVDVSLTGE